MCSSRDRFDCQTFAATECGQEQHTTKIDTSTHLLPFVVAAGHFLNLIRATGLRTSRITAAGQGQGPYRAPVLLL